MTQEDQELSPQERQLGELGEAARNAGSIVTEQINTIVDTAVRRAEGITREAERDAEMARREAHESARRVLERIGALERPLGDLVMTLRHEMNKLSGELEGRSPDVISHAVEVPSQGDRTIPPPQPESPAREEPREPEPPAQAEEPEAVQPEASRREPAFAEPARSGEETPPAPRLADEERAEEDAVEKPRKGMRGVVGRLRGKGRTDIFITTPGHCAVCQKSFAAGSPEALETSGWRVSGEVGLCPDCQGEGWQLPEGARLPFRSGSN